MKDHPWRGVKKLEKWRVQSRRYDHVKVTTLWLYPELDCSSCIQEIMPASGEKQLDYFVDYIRRRYPQEWDADAVSIYWTVCGETDGFCEQAPFYPDDELDVLTYFDPPVNIRTGREINWYQDLPVINHRFPEFAAALGWLPAPGQLVAPLRSIIAGTPQFGVDRASATGAGL